MSQWRLDVVLRIRSAVEERAAVTLGSAVASRIRIAGAADAARTAWEAAGRRARGDTASSISALHRAGEHLLQLALDARRQEASLAAAVRAEQASRDALLRARRDRQALSSLRDREERRTRRVREAALDEELMEHGQRRSVGRT